MTKIKQALRRQKSRIKKAMIDLCEDNWVMENKIREYFGEKIEDMDDWGSIGEPE